MDGEFMDTFSKGLAQRDIRVVRFEFPYMSMRRKTGKRRPPDREPILWETWLRVIESPDAEGLAIPDPPDPEADQRVGALPDRQQ